MGLIHQKPHDHPQAARLIIHVTQAQGLKFGLTALQHILGHFGCGQLPQPHCSSGSLLGSLPVLSAYSFTSSWQLLFLNQRKMENGHRIIFHDQVSTKECAGWGDWTRGRLHAKRTCFWSSYCTRSKIEKPSHQRIISGNWTSSKEEMF